MYSQLVRLLRYSTLRFSRTHSAERCRKTESPNSNTPARRAGERLFANSESPACAAGWHWLCSGTTSAKTVNALLVATAVLGLCTATATAESGTTANRKLTIRLIDDKTNKPLTGIVRIKTQAPDRYLKISELIERKHGWHTIPSQATIAVPATEVTIEALRGLQWELSGADVNTEETSEVTLRLRQFHDAKQRGWRNGNTHLHIMKRSREEAERYLREVPEADGLELVFLSHLRRIPDETTYISNEIVEQNWSHDTLEKLSNDKVIFRPGEEHRHNFGRGGEGFGHVMLLDIAKLIRPVSIGPGIMRSGSDAMPLERGIREARSDGATVVWCHNTNGFEDIPNWMMGTLHAQNIFDGGNRGTYEDSFYRYLNLGMKIPFSTGTDWFIDDFSRVYVPLTTALSGKAWLKQLRAGRTFITNGPLMEFEVDGRTAGHVFQISAPKDVHVTATAAGRVDFGAIELIQNGEVIHRSPTTADGGHYNAALNETVSVSEPCWLAVRTVTSETRNALGKPVFGHTSPVYFDLRGQPPFRREVALELIQEIEESLQVIREKAVFANDAEDQAVMKVYRQGIAILKNKIAEHAR